MVDAVLTVAAGLVVCCLVVSACAENAGGQALKKRLPHAPDASSEDCTKPSTKKRRRRDRAAPVRVRNRDGYYCAGCGTCCELPIYFEIATACYFAQVMLCCDCWETAAKNGFKLEFQARYLDKIYQDALDS